MSLQRGTSPSIGDCWAEVEQLRQALAAALEACLERGRPLEPAEQERLLEEYRTGGERK